jgi:glycosyltransferase involved in cell wall biosynthesis
MAAGCLILATAWEGIAETVGQTAGILIPPETGPTLRRSIESALRQLLQQPDLVQRSGRVARARYEAHFTATRFHTSWMEAIHEALAPPL